MTKFQGSFLLVSLVFLIGIVTNIHAHTLSEKASQDESLLRLSEPVEAIAADLESFVPAYMHEQNINPDVAVEIAHRALGGEIEPIRRAIHLEFNYRQDDG